MDISWEFSLVDIVVAIAAVVVIVLFFVARHFSRKTSAEGIDRKFFREQWRRIEELLNLGKEMNYKLAVIEADKLLDEALKKMYFPGTTMAERLKLATYKFPKLGQVRWAHAVRNQVVHDAYYSLKYNETRKVLELFKQALKILNVL